MRSSRVIGGDVPWWYIFGTRWRRDRRGATPERTYKIGHAVSRDGVSWSREEARQIVADRLGAGRKSGAADGHRVSAARYHMFFCYRQSSDFRTNRDRGYRIGHAWSDDLVRWTRDDDGVGSTCTPGEWDSDMQCYPHVFECEGRVHLLYNGNEFGRHGFGLATLES